MILFCFQLLKVRMCCFSFVIYESNWNIFGLWTVTKLL